MSIEVLYQEPNLLQKERVMLLANKVILANVLVGSAVLATVGTAAFAHALTERDCRNRPKDRAVKMRDYKDKMCNRSPDMGDAEEA